MIVLLIFGSCVWDVLALINCSFVVVELLLFDVDCVVFVRLIFVYCVQDVFEVLFRCSCIVVVVLFVVFVCVLCLYFVCLCLVLIVCLRCDFYSAYIYIDCVDVVSDVVV